MRKIRKLSFGGKLALGHFTLLATALLLPMVPQPAASVTSGDHWFWWFLQVDGWLILLFSFPASMFFGHSLHGMFVGWMNERMLIPLFFIFAANSFAVGYGCAYALSIIRKRRTREAA